MIRGDQPLSALLRGRRGGEREESNGCDEGDEEGAFVHDNSLHDSHEPTGPHRERRELGDEDVLKVLDKMLKQRRDSAQQYTDAGREELAAQEHLEIDHIQAFLPAQLSEAELSDMVDTAIAACDATGMQAMGPVMGQLKPQLQGRADIGAVSQMVKSRLVG